jgi:hypothetical protein
VSLNRDQRYSRCFHTGLWIKLQEIDADEFCGVRSNLHHSRSDHDDICRQEVNQAGPALTSAMTITTASSTASMTFTLTPTGASVLSGGGTMVAGRLQRAGQSLRLLRLEGTRRLLT